MKNGPWKSFRRVMVTAGLVLVSACLCGSLAVAALPAPQWLPGQPMLAGPQIIAMWMPVIGATKYVIYLNGAKLMDSPANQYIGPAPEKAGVYNYEIAAVDATGAEGAKSSTGKIEIITLDPPGKPIFRDDPDNKALNIRWTTVKGAVTYDLYKGDSEKGPWNLLASLQDINYKDSNLEFEKDYFYSVVAKDISGKASDRSEALKARIKKVGGESGSKSYKLGYVAMKQGEPIDWFGDIPTKACNGVNRDPDGTLWGGFGPYIARMGEDLVPEIAYVIDPGFRFPEGDEAPKFKVVYIAPPKDLAKPMKITGLNRIDDRTLLVCDEANSLLFELDLDKEEYVWKSKPVVKPTKEQNEKVYESQPDRFKAEPPGLGVGAKLPDGSYVVMEKTGSFWILVDDKGETVDWFAYYLSGDPAAPTEQRLNAAGEMMVQKDGTVIATLPLNKGIIRLDPKTRFAKWFAGTAATFVGNFLSLSGWTQVPGRPTQWLVADNTLSHLQVFDFETGDYQYSMSLPDKKPDPAFNNNRPLVDFTSPRSPFFSLDGKKFYFQNAGQQYFYQYDVLDPFPESKKP